MAVPHGGQSGLETPKAPAPMGRGVTAEGAIRIIRWGYEDKGTGASANAIQLRALSLRASPQTGAAIRFL